MSSFSEEIQQLQFRILELEKQKKETEENNKKSSIDHNLTVINDVLTQKKKSIINNRYSKSVPLARFYDEELVNHLEAVYNILRILDNRLTSIEVFLNKDTSTI